VEQPLQLAFAQIDRSSALDERISELLATSAAHLPQDPLRSLYFANEALLLADSEALPASVVVTFGAAGSAE